MAKAICEKKCFDGTTLYEKGETYEISKENPAAKHFTFIDGRKKIESEVEKK